MREHNIVHHTYQMKQDHPYRIVLKKLLRTTPVEEIKRVLKETGHTVLNIINVRHRQTKSKIP